MGAGTGGGAGAAITARLLSCLPMTYQAWTTPGSQHSIVNKTLIIKSAPHPAFRTTDSGGMRMARKYNRMLPLDDGISFLVLRGRLFLFVTDSSIKVLLRGLVLLHRNDTRNC